MPLHDPDQHARDEPDSGVSDHDGILRVPDARRQHAVRAQETLQPPRSLGLAVGGPLAVLIAAFIVRSLPAPVCAWLVVVVIVYTAVDDAAVGVD